MNSPVNYVDPWGMNTSSPTVAQDNGGIFASAVNSAKNTASFVGSAINNGLVQPVNTLLNLPNQAADAIAGHFGWSDFDTADERFAAAQSTPIPGDDLVFGALATVSRAARGSETVQRAMSRIELGAIQNSGVLSRGGRAGPHYVSNAVNSTANRARQRLSLPGAPEVRVTMDVPIGIFSSPSRVKPQFNMPGGGMERIAPGHLDIPVTIRQVEDL